MTEKPFIAEYKDTKQKVMVIHIQPNGWVVAVDETSGDFKFAKSLRGYRFVKWV